MSAKRKNPELDAQHQAILKNLMQQPENKVCAECRSPSPRWASANIGVFLCIACSGLHRKLGTHISQVRSVNLDTWTPEQITQIQNMGNAKAAQLYEACLPKDARRPQPGDTFSIERWIRDKYQLKLYVKVEDGGLGGVRGRAAKTLSRQGNSGYSLDSAPLMYNTSINPYARGGETRSSFPSHGSRHAGDDYDRQERASYVGGGKFNRNRIFAEHGVPRFGRGASPYQRAAVMKNLLDMGFSASVASKAVEASGGDIERAVEWVLANNPHLNAPDRNTDNSNAGSGQPPPKRDPPQVEVNLLDFGGEENVPETQKVTTNDLLLDVKTNDQWTKKEKQSVQDEASGFGEFEGAELATQDARCTDGSDVTAASVLQTNSVSKPPVLQTSSTSALTATLAKLYRSVPSTGHSTGAPCSSTSNPSPAGSVASRTFSTPKVESSSAAEISLRRPTSTETKTRPSVPDQKIPKAPSEPLRVSDSASNKQDDDPFADLIPVARKAYQTRTGPTSHHYADQADIPKQPNSQPKGGLSLNDLLGNVKLDN